MNDDELGRLLAGALDAQAREAVGDAARPPVPRFTTEPATAPRRRRFTVLAPVAAAALVIALVGVLFAVTRSTAPHHPSAAAGTVASTGRSAAPSPSAAARRSSEEAAASSAEAAARSAAVGNGAASTAAAGAIVHVKLVNAENAVYGVGMPVIALLSRPITSGVAFQQATTVTVDGRAAQGAWYFERSQLQRGYPIEAHLRLRTYWPAHAKVHVAVAARGLAAGGGERFGDDVAVDFATGAAMISVVDDQTHLMTVRRDGKQILTAPVSLGASRTPTMSGVKVVMQKGVDICMSGPGYDECNVKYTQRLTYSGEYLHAAPWNADNIKRGIDTSNGCTNLLMADAHRLFLDSHVGDVVLYPHTTGPKMQLGAGYGDWNVGWTTWRTGGLVPTS